MARALQIDAALSGFLDANGDPLSGGSLTVYDEGTTNLASIYAVATKSSGRANPVTLDTYGSTSGPIFVDGKVKLLLKDSAGTTIKTWDQLTYSASVFIEDVSKEIILGVGRMVLDASINTPTFINATLGNGAGATPQGTGADYTGLIQMSDSDVPIGATVTRFIAYGKLSAGTALDYVKTSLKSNAVTANPSITTVDTVDAIGDVEGSGFFAVSKTLGTPLVIAVNTTYWFEEILRASATPEQTILTGIRVFYTKSWITDID